MKRSSFPSGDTAYPDPPPSENGTPQPRDEPLAENRPYWLRNVLVRYDNMASQFQAKILQIEAVAAQHRRTGQLPSPDQLGFLVPPASVVR